MKMKTVLNGVLSLSIIAVTAIGLYNMNAQNFEGRYSIATTVSQEEREWILQRFGREYETVEECISVIQEYARKNFIYKDDMKYKFYVQHFDFHSVVDGDTVSGVCFDFAILGKKIFLVLQEEGCLPVTDMQVFVADIAYLSGSDIRHAYNFLQLSDGTKYYFDLTWTRKRAAEGLPPSPNETEVFTEDFEAFCARYSERLYYMH